MPVIAARCLRHGIPLKHYYRSRDVRYRFSAEGHLDLMDYVADFGAAKPSKLDVIAKLCGMPGKVGTGWAYFAGFCGGLFGMLFGAGGPPYAIYLSHRDLSKEHFRATLSITSAFSIGIRAVALAVTGMLLRVDVWLTAALVVPTALLGVALATRVFRRVSRELLMRLVALLLLATGVSLIARAASMA